MSVLIVKPDHLGDFALALPTLWRLSEEGGEAQKQLVLGDAANAEWAQLLPWFPRFTAIQHPRYLRSSTAGARWRSGWQGLQETGKLRREEWTLGLELTASAHDLWGKAWLRAAGCRVTRGQAGHGDFLLTQKIKPQQGHQAERLAELAGLTLDLEGRDNPHRWLPEKYRWDQAKTEKTILFSPWAGQTSKRWNWSAWSALIREQIDHEWLMLTPLAHQREAEEYCRAEGATRLRMCLTSSISETLLLLRCARLAVVLDTALAHYAWVVGTPIVQLFSGTAEPARWRSLAQGKFLTTAVSCAPCKSEVCRQAQHDCMNGITVESVRIAVHQILREYSK